MYNCPNFSYNFIKNTPYGERKQITYGNGTVTNYDYDVRRRMEHVNHQFPAFNIDKQYVYDPLSNITDILTDPGTVTSPSTGVLGGPVNHSYTYDNYNRLIHAEGHYVGPDDEPTGMLKQAYALEMTYDLSHNILAKNQIHQFGSVTSYNQSLPAHAPHAPTSYALEYDDYAKGVYIADGRGYAQPHAPRMITEYPPDYANDPDDMRVKKKMIDYDANGNQKEIREQVSDPEEPLGYREVAVRENLWDEEDRLRAVDLDPEAPADKPQIASYIYSADGERTVRYLPGRLDAYYSAKDAGSADRLESLLYPNSLVTVKTLPLPEGLAMDEIDRISLTKYTKHYYIGSERVASALGTVRDLGLLCEQSGFPDATIIERMNDKVDEAGTNLTEDYATFGKNLILQQPFYYDTRMMLGCDGNHDPKLYAAYWYHPDHLGSSSYITNLDGEINQHMEYLPFGETLVEEHLNSYNSPFKFNAKEFDNETGNYYYSARYYSPKYNLMLSMDQMYYLYPSFSPYAYTLQNPVRFVDPTGMAVESPDHEYRLGKDGNITLIKETDDNFDRLYNSDNIMVGQVNKGYLSDGINIEENGLFLDVQNKEDFHSYMNFTLDLSIEVNKEIGGFILDSESGFDNVYIASYKENEPRSAKGFVNFINSSSYDIPNKELSIGGKKHKANAWFHTHPDIMSPGYGSSRPSLEDRNATKDLQIPGVVLGGWGGIGLINTDGTYIRWGK